MNLASKLGELRGEFMAAKRIAAFTEKYGVAPDFAVRIKNGIPEDFLLSAALVDDNKCYEEFDSIIRNSLQQLGM